MQEKVRIENLSQSNIEDLIYVCSSMMLGSPIHQKGISLKKGWLMDMLQKHGSCAKVAYYNEKPVAQILARAHGKRKVQGRNKTGYRQF